MRHIHPRLNYPMLKKKLWFKKFLTHFSKSIKNVNVSLVKTKTPTMFLYSSTLSYTYRSKWKKLIEIFMKYQVLTKLQHFTNITKCKPSQTKTTAMFAIRRLKSSYKPIGCMNRKKLIEIFMISAVSTNFNKHIQQIVCTLLFSKFVYSLTGDCEEVWSEGDSMVIVRGLLCFLSFQAFI